MSDEPKAIQESGEGNQANPHTSVPSPDPCLPSSSNPLPYPSSFPQRESIAHAPLSVILWAHNCELELSALLDEWHRCLCELAPIHEIIFVDDCSTDETVRVANEWALAHPDTHVFKVKDQEAGRKETQDTNEEKDEEKATKDEVKTCPTAPRASLPLHHPSPLHGGGAGACLRVGLALARYPLVAYCELRVPRPLSPRGAYRPDDLKSMLEIIDEVDIVCGFRTKASRRVSVPRRERLYRWLARLAFGVRLKDVYCPFKLFRRHVFKRIPIQSNGDFVHAEILAKANFLGCLMTEVPVELRDQGRESLRFAEALQIFRHPDFGPPIVPEERNHQSLLPQSETQSQPAANEKEATGEQ
jgi:glycosyltransferase involved in cell wall biosynthesis